MPLRILPKVRRQLQMNLPRERIMSQDNWEVTAEHFEIFVGENENRLTIVHFWAQWNPLDRPMQQVVRDVHDAVGTQIAFARVEVGPPINQDLCRWIGISQVPTMIFVFRHRIVDVKVGYSKNRLVNHVQMLMQNFNEYTPVLPPPTLMPGMVGGAGHPGQQSASGMIPGQFSAGNGSDSNAGPQMSTQNRPSIRESQIQDATGREVQGTQLGPSNTLSPNYAGQSNAGGMGSGIGNRTNHPMMKYGLYPFVPPQPNVAPAPGKKSWLGRLFGEM